MPQTRSLSASKSSFLASTRRQISSVFCMTGLLVSEAGNQVVIHHPGRLHEGIAYGRADKAEAPFGQRLAHLIRQGGGGRHLLALLPAIHQWLAADEGPEISVEAAMFGDHIERDAGVVAHRMDLQPVTNDAR